MARIIRRALLAMAWLQPVIERYKQVGLASESERVALLASEKGRGLSDDLKTIEVEVKIDGNKINRMIDNLLSGDDLERKLLRIGRECVPSEERLKKSLDDQRVSAPLTSLFERHIVTSDGFTTARVGSIQEDLDGRIELATA